MASYEDLSREELLDIIKQYSTGPHAKIYELGVKKIASLTKAFNKINIDVKGDSGDKVFDNLMKFLEKGIKISDELERIQKRIDPEVKARLRAELEAEEEFSPEWFAKQKENM